jgi:hypothetical protein
VICSTCPNCGLDLDVFEQFECGHLTVIGNAVVYWRGRRVPLSVTERLLLIALARAGGAWVAHYVLADAIGYEGPTPSKLLDVHFCRLRQKFRAVDPAFDQVERENRGCHSEGSARWRAEAYIIPELCAVTDGQRAMHKLMLTHPRRSIPEWAALRGFRSHSVVSQQLRALEARKLAQREPHYRRGWAAVGTLAMHAELEARRKQRSA